MSEATPRRPKRVTRRQMVAGMGAATFGGVVAGGAGGFLGGKSTDSQAASTAKGKPITIGVLAPVTGAGAPQRAVGDRLHERRREEVLELVGAEPAAAIERP